MIIAEIGINHNGDMTFAKMLVNAAIEAGADAVKFQLFHIEKLKKYQLSEDQIAELHDYCEGKIEFLCTPFDKEAVDFLAPLVPRFKIGSGQANDTDFLEYVNAKGKPVILSTGMSRFPDIRHALTVLDVPVTLLHCVSRYPTPAAESKLWRIKRMIAAFSCEIGYSDHTEGIAIALAAAALGAKIIEKHVTLDRDMVGPDHRASITPAELKALVQGVKAIRCSLTES